MPIQLSSNIIRLPLNNHWTTVEQTLFKPAQTIKQTFPVPACSVIAATKPFPLGRGWGRLQKSNNFESFFVDSTLTFLTFGNTFRLPILPSRRTFFLCLPQILLCLPLIFLCLPLIFPGCASKSPILKGKWRKKGGAEAPPISLYKYNTFHRQKQEVLKPK